MMMCRDEGLHFRLIAVVEAVARLLAFHVLLLLLLLIMLVLSLLLPATPIPYPASQLLLIQHQSCSPNLVPALNAGCDLQLTTAVHLTSKLMFSPSRSQSSHNTSH